MIVSTITLGQSGATPIVVSLEPNTFVSGGVKSVLLSQDYVRNPSAAPGYPVYPAGAAYAALVSDSTPHTFTSGTTFQCYASETAAIVAAGGGTLV